MGTSTGSLFVIVLALICANLPFVNQRVLALLPARWPCKPFWLRGVELVAMYAVVGLVGFGIESGQGNAFSQGWQFYAITACLMLVFAFPGFTWQYLVRRQRH
ncbi:hypothetical protein CJO75_06950 [Ralstonia solanacearum]|uniref:DUF2818 family protein n=1 Tax=Ralstonia pseudosolanacearum TaxID=1310165 RepID=UPI000E56B395|nr:hypothetical protein CJO75_06950 [Ralstonia solanacearum]AXW14723.1 hypothetical protein CJO84_06890 [Ralstonia solanacearum]AXW38079.1 hypothetical protein CJO89_07005 [Ralstonia solanacearum]AXW70925.1 hypothetical protein CJO96_07000 [Ralstonia solanacearum]BEU66839.1 DUF2818 family protein [Ralstonia pseudosolanacearum]